MDIGKTGMDRALGAALNGLSARQRVIGDNLANVDTPGFKASDVSFEAALRQAGNRVMAAGSGQTFQLSHGTGGMAFDGRPADPLAAVTTVTQRTDSTMRQDGNNVDVDEQMVELAEANISYNALTQLTGSRMSLLKTIINDGRR